MKQKRISFAVTSMTENSRKRRKIDENTYQKIDLDESQNNENDLNSDNLTRVRQTLHNSLPNQLMCRETELSEIYSFLKIHAKQKTSGSMYISGLPGTGKTACVSKVTQRTTISRSYRIVSINCTLSTSHANIYEKIADGLNLRKLSGQKTYEKSIVQHFESNNKMTLLIFDEIDLLVSKTNKTLEKLFNLTLSSHSRLVVIGIANTFNLIEDSIPKLLHVENRPETIVFATYNEHQIETILKNRLGEADSLSLVSDAALKILAKKVAAMSGDVRTALDLFQKVLDHFEITNDRTVEIKHVLGALSNFFGTSKTIATLTNRGLPLHQKVILAVIVIIKTEKKMKSLTLSQLYENYCKICARAKHQALDQCEFNSTCSLIEANGAIKIHWAKNIRLSKVTLESDHNNLLSVLQENGFLNSIMHHATLEP